MIDQIEKLKEQYPKSKDLLDRKKIQYKISKEMLKLKDNIAIKKLENELTNSINAINSKLLSGDKMTEQERDLLLCDRERCEWFVYQFPNAERIIDNINKFIKKYE